MNLTFLGFSLAPDVKTAKRVMMITAKTASSCADWTRAMQTIMKSPVDLPASIFQARSNSFSEATAPPPTEEKDKGNSNAWRRSRAAGLVKAVLPRQALKVATSSPFSAKFHLFTRTPRAHPNFFLLQISLWKDGCISVEARATRVGKKDGLCSSGRACSTSNLVPTPTKPRVYTMEHSDSSSLMVPRCRIQQSHHSRS
jgi:hypothetical protein